LAGTVNKIQLQPTYDIKIDGGPAPSVPSTAANYEPHLHRFYDNSACDDIISYETQIIFMYYNTVARLYYIAIHQQQVTGNILSITLFIH